MMERGTGSCVQGLHAAGCIGHSKRSATLRVGGKRGATSRHAGRSLPHACMEWATRANGAQQKSGHAWGLGISASGGMAKHSECRWFQRVCVMSICAFACGVNGVAVLVWCFDSAGRALSGRSNEPAQEIPDRWVLKCHHCSWRRLFT